MAKILQEYNDNKYAKTIHEVEEFMREKGVELIIIGGDQVQVTILDKKFELRKAGIVFPRQTEDEKLYVPD